ncbi:hypothetical protein ACF068_30550 [Streptomyces sp. NPDC016309]|uniref:hypothetical protein n=1 Tax=Streptomyces sp. NPDC016309 TaxID=3364965 RepID=UPI0036FFF3D7
MPADLQRIDKQRADAAVEVKLGQQLLEQKKYKEAETVFRKALGLDAGNAAARAGRLSASEKQPSAQGLSAEKESWDTFYSNTFVPLLQLAAAAAIGVVVLGALSGLVAHFVVKPHSVTWNDYDKQGVALFGAFLLIGCALMLPLYAMFEPFSPTRTVLDLGRIFLVVAVVVGISAVARTRSRPEQSLKRVLKDWFGFWGWLVGVPAGALLLGWWTGLSTPHERLLVLFIALSCVAVLLTAASLGQLLRLQVEARGATGAADAAATDYLLARLRNLGTERPPGLNAVPAVTSLSSIPTEDLSALPVGKVAGALSRIFFALRPDRTWQARVVWVDENRVAVTLNRNGKHAESVIISRRDLGLPAVDDDKANARLRAQLLTGAAAIILVRLSKSHPQLRPGLCGARDWRSVTLQVIANSRSLIDNPDDKVALLGRAVHEDQNNLLARLEYLWAHQKQAGFDSPLYSQIAQTVDRLLGALTESGDSWRTLRIRGYYRSTSQWLNLYAESGYSDRNLLRRARRSCIRLEDACETADADRHEPVDQLAKRTRPLAATLRSTIDALITQQPPARPPDPIDFRATRLAYTNACLDCSLLEISGGAPPYADHAVQHLRVGLPAERDVDDAKKDPRLAPVHSYAPYQDLVGVPPKEFLKLQPFADTAFAGVADKLAVAGLSNPREIIRRTIGVGRTELATYLNVSPLLVDRIRQIALLTQVHPDLGDPVMLHLLLKAGIDSPTRLKEHVENDRSELMRELRQIAEAEGAPSVKGIRRPRGWLTAAKKQYR